MLLSIIGLGCHWRDGRHEPRSREQQRARTRTGRRAVLLKASWQAAWRRAPGDVWLIAGTGEKVVAVQHQRRPGATPIPNEAERLALAEPMTREPGECPRPFSDVLALLPHQMGYDESVTLSPEKARSMLSAVLAKHARFRHLEFVLHGCYGEDCVGAVFSDRAETEAF